MSTPTPLTRYHQVLLAVSKAPAGLNLSDLVRETKLPRSSAHRIASALCSIGYLETDATDTYAFGPAFRDLLKRSLMADNRLQAFQPALQYLVAELGETAFFARFVNGTVNLAQAVTPTSPERSYIYPGTGPRPLDTCSSSKAILAFADQQLVEDMFRSGSLPLDASTSLPSFMAHLHQVSHDGYAICDGEIDEGVFSLACPVHIGSMLGVYSIGVVGPANRMKAVKVQHLVQVVRHAAALASENLIRNVNTHA